MTAWVHAAWRLALKLQFLMTAAPSYAWQTFETCVFAKTLIQTSPKNPQGCSPSSPGKKEFTSEGIVLTYQGEFEHFEPVYSMYFRLVSALIPLYFVSGSMSIVIRFDHAASWRFTTCAMMLLHSLQNEILSLSS